jgi:hypothetical protein
MPSDPTLTRYLDARPTDEETAREAVRGTRDLSPPERIAALESLLRAMDVLLAGRLPVRPPADSSFWRHWKDPSLGRPG